MDQNKQGQQQPDGFTGQPQSPHQGSQDKGSQQGSQFGERKWQDPPQTQNPKREPAEGPRNIPGDQERGRGQGGGVTNQESDRDMDEQEELPDRGTPDDQSER